MSREMFNSVATGYKLEEVKDIIIDGHYFLYGVPRPQRIGYFSTETNESGESLGYLPSLSSLTFLRQDYKKWADKNLLEGFDPAIRWGRSRPNPNHILKWYSNNRNIFDPDEDIDFICQSRPIKSILKTNLPDSDPWKIYAAKVHGSIIISEVDTAKRMNPHFVDHINRVLGSYAGYKFAEQIVEDIHGKSPVTKRGGNRNSFYLVNKWQLGSHSLLYACRVDCCLDRKDDLVPFSDMQFAHIKTSSVAMKFIGERKVNRTIDWWTNSFVSGVAPVVVAEKSRKHQVRNVTILNGFAAKVPCYILTDRISFLHEVLTFIKDNVHMEMMVYEFQMDKDGQLCVSLARDNIAEYIPSWYLHNEFYDAQLHDNVRA